jgi:hypothetical protein
MVLVPDEPPVLGDMVLLPELVPEPEVVPLPVLEPVCAWAVAKARELAASAMVMMRVSMEAPSGVDGLPLGFPVPHQQCNRGFDGDTPGQIFFWPQDASLGCDQERAGDQDTILSLVRCISVDEDGRAAPKVPRFSPATRLHESLLSSRRGGTLLSSRR